MKKLLLGTTAVAGAIALTGAAYAGELQLPGALDLRISGDSDFGIEYAEEDLDFGEDGPREFFFNQDHEIQFRATGVGDATGITYGVNLELELDTGEGTNAQWDEAWGFISGNFGEFRFGNEDSVVDILSIQASSNNAGTGGLDGNQRTVGDPKLSDSGEATKIIYYTPEIAGFQAGVNYAINEDDAGESAGSNEAISDLVELGGNWQGAFAGFDLGVFAGLAYGDDPDEGSYTNWQIGGEVGFAGFSVAAHYADEDEDVFGRDDHFGVGVGTEIAGFGASFAFQQDTFADEDQRQYVLSGDTGLLPGVSLAADAAWVENLEGDDDRDGFNILGELKIDF